MTTLFTSILQPSKNYSIRFSIAKGDGSGVGIASSQIGAHLSSDTSFFNNSKDTLSLIPQIEYTDTPITKTDWVKIQGCYTAQGDEEFITIGNFRSDANTQVSDTASGFSAYYYIDDVSVVPVEPRGLPSGGDTSLCRGDSIRLSTVVDSITDYEWSPSHGLSSDTVSNPLASPDTSTAYTITKRTYCDTTTAQVTVNVLDTPSVKLPRDSCVQVSDSLELSPSSISAGAIPSWSPSQGLLDTASASTLAFPESSTTYTLTVTDTFNGCPASDSVRIVPAHARPSDTALCRGDTLQFLEEGHPEVSYTWSPPFGIDDPNSADALFFPDSSRGYQLSTQSDCDTALRSVQITVHDPPAIEAGADRELPKGDATAIGSSPEANTLYYWEPIDGLSDPATNPTNASPGEDRSYVLSATDTLTGCASSDTVHIDVLEKDLFIPNVFAPGSKDHEANKSFRVLGGPFEEYHLQVFNRWGELVFESEDPEDGWDGRSNGEPLEAGVYVYRFHAVLGDGTEVERDGDVTLVR